MYLLWSFECSSMHWLTCRKHEASGREVKMSGPVDLSHSVHVSGQSVFARAFVRPWKTVDPLAPFQVAENVGPVSVRGGRGRAKRN